MNRGVLMKIISHIFKYTLLLLILSSKQCSGFVLLQDLLALSQQGLVPPKSPVEFKNQAINFLALSKNLGFEFPSKLARYYQTIDRSVDKDCIYKDVYDQTVDNRNIDGWFDKRLIILLAIIDNFQSKTNISGNVAEIGVWQGRSFIPLILLTRNDECALAIDCFEQYESNLDNSGGSACSTSIFIKNVTSYCQDLTKLRKIKGDSFKFTAQDYLKETTNNQGIRIFSIDGCHEALPTERDMENAFKCLVDGGIVIMDDYFHETWPGVSEGTNRFMLKNEGKLKPFFIGWNKIFFAKPDHVKEYYELIKSVIVPKDLNIKKFFGVDTLIYDPRP